MSVRRGFLQSGHFPTLMAALLYFDVSFMVWVILGPLAPFLREQFGLSATEQGFVVAVPLLAGSFFRPILGACGDCIGGRRAGLIGLTLSIAPLVIGWRFAHSVWHLYALGTMLGVAGASFAVALPLASGSYPPEHQGLAMGIAGAGNSGSLLATLAAPRLAERYGWTSTFGLAALPVLTVLAIFALMAKDSPSRRVPARWRDYATVLREPDTIWFSFLYGLTFGGFVGFTSFLPTFFREQYLVSRVAAGDLTTLVVVSGSLLRPIGGWVSDRVGGYRLLLVILAAVGGCVLCAATLPQLPMVIAVLFIAVGLLGMGNGAVFQLVPQRFPGRMGLITGVVGAAGGLGGFFFPTVMGAVRDLSGSYALGMTLFAAAFIAGALILLELGTRWSAQWQTPAIEQSGVFCYRGRVRAIFGDELA